MRDNLFLALNIGHNASAALMRNGVVVAAAPEERFCRIKNFVGYPKQAIEFCLRKEGVKASQLSKVAGTTIENSGLLVKAQTSTQFSLRDYIEYYDSRYYGPKLRGENTNNYLRWLNEDPKFNQGESYIDWNYLTEDVFLDPKKDADEFTKAQIRTITSHLGISADKVEFIDHHTCHAYYAYFASPFRGKDCISLTLDGWGDGRNQTVWKVSNEELELLADSDQNDLARIYKLTTLILGMRPDEHEFKVMGLAAYAKDSYVKKTMALIQDLLKVEGMRVRHKDRPKDLYKFLKGVFEDQRFDNIAGAVQAYTEEVAKQLVKNIAKETGISRFVLSGGVAMNVKMNKALSELDEVDDIFVAGSGGDESLSIGGCYYLNRSSRNNAPLKTLYLGSDINDEMKTFDPSPFKDRYDVTTNVDLAQVACLIERGDTVSVVRGRAEFGARALGNRSILANPSKRETVQKINEAIKNRDFWMPFALSVLEENANDYLYNPKGLQSPFMAISLDARPERYFDIVAGTHPYDRTVRPQFVSAEYAPDYHRLISEFKKITGIPALLNTSFNLHGEPIVDTIEDAIRTFENSGLDHLLINDRILLSKKSS